VFALGVVSVFEQILESFPADEREQVFKAYIEALDEKPDTFKADAARLEKTTAELSGPEQLMPDANGSDVQVTHTGIPHITLESALTHTHACTHLHAQMHACKPCTQVRAGACPHLHTYTRAHAAHARMSPHLLALHMQTLSGLTRMLQFIIVCSVRTHSCLNYTSMHDL